MSSLGSIDIRKALVDFEGDTQDVGEVLLLFLDELDLSLIQLAEVPAGGPAHVASVLHEIANSLESAWCFRGGERVRSLERVCRRDDEDADFEAIKQEVVEILIDAAEHAQAWLQTQLPH